MYILKGSTFATLMLASAAAFAIPFDLTTPDSVTDPAGSYYAGAYNYSSEGINLSVSGYSNRCEDNGSAYCEEVFQSWTGLFGSYGLGVEIAHSPNHAVDNQNGDIDMLLLSFDQAVSLATVTTGWSSNDSDLSIFAYTGSSSDVGGDMVGEEWLDILQLDWTLDGHYLNVHNKPGHTAEVNYDEMTSTHWLIGAYFEPLADPSKMYGDNPTWGSDYFKLKAVTVDTPPTEVPEPPAYLLMILGGLMLIQLRRSQRQ